MSYLKNINFYFDDRITNKEKIKLIKDKGFDGIFLMCDEDFDENVILAKENDLFIESAHLPYKNVCNTIWLDDEAGDLYTESTIDWIKRISKAGIRIAIIHMAATITPPKMSEIGFERLNKIVRSCEENNVYLAMENVHDWDYVHIPFKKANSSYVKMCLDFGHANGFTKDINKLNYKEIAKDIICLHIHDNFGERDQHLIPFDGNIDFNFILKELKSNGFKGNLTLELECEKLYSNTNDYITKAKIALDKLGEIYDE